MTWRWVFKELNNQHSIKHHAVVQSPIITHGIIELHPGGVWYLSAVG